MSNTYHLKQNFPTHEYALAYILELHSVLVECSDYFCQDKFSSGPARAIEMKLLTKINEVL